MTIDLTGGLGDDREFLHTTRPDDPEMRESVNCWLWDEGVDFGLPRIGVEALAAQWDAHDIQVNLAFADGRVYSMYGPGPSHDPIGADGRARTLGAGPLSFELIEPYRHWKVRIDGLAEATTIDAQVAGWVPGDSGDNVVPLHLDVEIRHTVPPWESGSLLEEAGRVLATQEEGDLMGGPRFEQLFLATGTLRVGDREHPISGGGLRIRRTGVRRLARFRGHAWQSAVFPSGRAFGHCVYPPRDDGKPTFNEGFLFDGDGALIPARVVEAPWLRTTDRGGQDVSVVLETAAGTTTIAGESVLSTIKPLGAGEYAFTLQQAIARYTWDGETANGMLERSTANQLLEDA